MKPEEQAAAYAQDARAQKLADAHKGIGFALGIFYTSEIEAAFLAGVKWACGNDAGWFSLKERLPVPGEWCLLYSPSRGVGVDVLKCLTPSGPVFWGDGNDVCDATHFIPLPPAPKQEGEK